MKKIIKHLIAASILLVIIFSACVYLDSINVNQLQEDGSQAPIINAGDTATFKVNGHIEAAGDGIKNTRLIIAILAPKSWNVRENVKMSFQLTVLSPSWDNVYNMSAIPLDVLPKSAGGATWPDALYKKYGSGNNVLSDMEWVAFQSNDLWSLLSGEKPYFEVTIKCKTAMQNLRVRLGFFLNHSDDGLSTSNDHFKVMYSEPFLVENGTGTMIDYVSYHYNAVEPLISMQDDFVTFSFVGGAYSNELLKTDEVYMEAVAKTQNASYIINEKTDKTRMKKEDLYSDTYKLTIWPREYFNIPDGETIESINYFFTDKTGNIKITKSDDDIAGGEVPKTDSDPFVFELAEE